MIIDEKLQEWLEEEIKFVNARIKCAVTDEEYHLALQHSNRRQAFRTVLAKLEELYNESQSDVLRSIH